MPEYMYWYNNMIKGQTTYLCSWRTNISAWDFDGESLIWIFFTLHGWVIMWLYSSHPINTGVSHWENQSVGMQQTINVNQSKATLETYNAIYKTLSNYHQIKEALFFTPWICLWIYILNILVTVRYLLPSNNESVKIITFYSTDVIGHNHVFVFHMTQTYTLMTSFFFLMAFLRGSLKPSWTKSCKAA